MSKFLCEYCDEMTDEIDEYCEDKWNVIICEEHWQQCLSKSFIDDKCQEINQNKLLDKLTSENQKLKIKAEKLDKLIAWIKSSNARKDIDEDSQEDTDIWDFLGNELGIATNGCQKC
jgi:hypothetical protein